MSRQAVFVTVPGKLVEFCNIRLDRCAPCGITYFDAGEMTDLRYDTLADTVRGLIARLRRT